MPKLLICGVSNFQLEDLEDELPKSASAGSSPCSTPRRSRKSGFCKSHNNKDKNPYANRGLDKFSALLADLEEKRQKIYAETGSQDTSLVGFVYKNSNDLVPIVVKLKDNNNTNKDNKKKERKPKRSCSTIKNEDVKEIKQATSDSESQDKFPIETSIAVTEVKKESKPKSNNKKMLKWSSSWNMKLDMWKRPSFYLPVVVILILLVLTVFGRSVAILCTSISWYLVPTLQESSGRTRLLTKKKDYVKKLSDRSIVAEGLASSPRISHAGGSKEKSSPQHGHKKSW
ncbi:hypothetical protein L484_001040 [Morus notabilis]|uniref:ZCF37 n=1 Tax=Morus notabilis TaxID=981085 RepID=W9QW30_9ROSA|nr:uncharacterized protein LOC21384653 [Morus notabilis]EXB55840.1 hypothetical protein L484_001040 [Morus notabilis]